MSETPRMDWDTAADRAHWTPSDQVQVLLCYIQSQDSPEAFAAFLDEQVRMDLGETLLDDDPEE